MKNSLVMVAAAQYPILQHADFGEWRAHVADWVRRGVATGAQLLVFPEYGAMDLLSTFPANVQADIQQNLTALQPLIADVCTVFADLAQQHGCVIVAPSLPVQLGERFINRAFVLSGKGLVGWQDKWFMTRFEDEEWGVSGGDKQLTVFEADWGRFGIQICYDVEFPIGSQRLCAAGASLIVVPSCTETIRGATRVHVGARARALENQAYVLVSQTIGEARWSPIVDINFGYGACYAPPDVGLPEEGIVALGKPQAESWLTAALDLEAIAHVRRDGQVLNFRDQNSLEMRFPGEEIVVVERLV